MFRDMNKKILIGSIIAVVILIGISFTSVVGNQSTSRTIAEISPLFTVRSSRALDVDSKDLSYNYVGKGGEIQISILPRTNRISLFLNDFANNNKIKYDKLKQFLINSNNKFYQEKIYRDDNSIQELLTTLYQQNKDIIVEDNKVVFGTLTTNLYTICVWFPGCVPYMFIAGTYALFLVVFLIYLKISGFTSDPCLTVYIPCV